MGLGEIIGLIIVGLIVGALGRLFHPGVDSMGVLMTIAIGIASALLVGWLVGGGILGFILAVIVAVVLVALSGRERSARGLRQTAYRTTVRPR
jgi:uncharacterized membrane protein YeaQ/YmgE (transglycosylase-associated protein family)